MVQEDKGLQRRRLGGVKFSELGFQTHNSSLPLFAHRCPSLSEVDDDSEVDVLSSTNRTISEIQVIFCTEDMITRSLWEAVNTKQPNLDTVKIANSVPQICFLSGLMGEEMMMFVDAFPEIGLEPAVFAALVPNSADKPLQELIEEIMGDHEMLIGMLAVIVSAFLFSAFLLYDILPSGAWWCQVRSLLSQAS
ncbi:hypothetical protein RHMOL_Rhmol10G0136800 [Rhododendron molle]|uniref:Uncharacterized protein n=1 Tax=Rhododendron molle TaxID=49168 RepID=A0ACC0M320_RHOML|nr:hypothetical protein RHMOL_Rhmol10G0136800 [Rhododendron molle]